MKVRIGLSLGRGAVTLENLGSLSEGIEKYGFDSLWMSEVLTAKGFDPLVGLTWAAARHSQMKLGTTMLAPGRNVLRLAKSLASLDQLSSGRLLVTFVPGLINPPERDAIGVAPSARGAVIEELLPLLRALLSGEVVDHHGQFGSFEGVRIEPPSFQQPLEFWLGGMARSSLERCGRLADGWLPSLCTPEEATAGKAIIDETADASGRRIDPEHFGVSVAYLSKLDDAGRDALSARRPTRSTATPPIGLDALREQLEAYVEVGFSKFVLRPIVEPAAWDWPCPGLTDIHHQATTPGKDVHHGDHGKRETTTAVVL